MTRARSPEILESERRSRSSYAACKITALLGTLIGTWPQRSFLSSPPPMMPSESSLRRPRTLLRCQFKGLLRLGNLPGEVMRVASQAANPHRSREIDSHTNRSVGHKQRRKLHKNLQFRGRFQVAALPRDRGVLAHNAMDRERGLPHPHQRDGFSLFAEKFFHVGGLHPMNVAPVHRRKNAVYKLGRAAFFSDFVVATQKIGRISRGQPTPDRNGQQHQQQHHPDAETRKCDHERTAFLTNPAVSRKRRCVAAAST